MNDPTEPLRAVLTLYEKANIPFKIAMFIAVIWPFSMIATAMVLKPETAQTIVPIVDLIPLVAVFFLIIGSPFGLIGLLSHPVTKKGLTLLAALIGIELAIGVYFSTVPVSRDIGLVPLLILTSLALLFLRIGGIAGVLTKGLGLLIVGITLVFIFGGRRRFEFEVRNMLKPPDQVPVARLAPPTPASPPPHRPQAAAPAAPTNALAPAPTQTQLQPLQPDWEQSQKEASEDFVFEAAPCILRAANLHCFIRITNEGPDARVYIFSAHYPGLLDNPFHITDLATRVVDDLGNEYRAETVQIGSHAGNWPSDGLASGVPTLASATFENVSQNASQTTLLDTTIRVGAGTGKQLEVQFRNLPIQRQ